MSAEDLDCPSGPAFQVNRKVALSLALQTGITQRHGPSLSRAVILKTAIFQWRMRLLSYIVEDDPGLFVAGNGKAHPIREAGAGHLGAASRVADVAEVAQLGFSRNNLFASSAANSIKASAERQTGRERPSQGATLFTRVKIGAGHNRRIVSPSWGGVKDRN